MANKDLRGILDLTPDDVEEIFALAAELKAEVKRGVFRPLLANRTLAMIFEKPSLRTRTTFDVGMFQLGGHAIYISSAEVGLGKRESVPDVARNLERWVDLICARTFSHATVEGLAAHCSIPVVNALCDREHPCQALADFLTLREHFGSLDGLRLAYVGDGNNVAHSLMLLAALTGVSIRICTPKGYEPDPKIAAEARARHPRGPKSVWIGSNLEEGLAGSRAVYTDVWASMGQEAEAAERARIFAPFQVNMELLSMAEPNAKVMHCLPAHRGEEITSEALDSPNSIVLDQAENRLHAQKAVLAILHRNAQNG
ncbi:MAG: Ornithine carbamoyltransferase [candidate division BRC1 bacterium ADurb.BinA364]|nr:MAG: Ornithine carbamoyltransferase [candidate division BRC1 bacterium ADurb.BinA364]